MANYYNRFLRSAAQWPDLVALELRPSTTSAAAEPERYTFRKLQYMSDCVGNWLTTQDLDRNAKCAILAANGPRWVAAFLGILAAGDVAVPFDTALNQEQLTKLLRASDTSLLFVDERHLAAARQAAAELPIQLVLMETGEALRRDVASSVSATLDQILSSDPKGFNPREVDSHDVGAILYSSGTTGDPKGVMLTHDNMLAESEAILQVFGIGPADSILGILPLFHALALVTNLLLPLAAGTRVVFMESLNTTELLRALPSVNIFVSVPQFFYLIHERIWKEVKARGRAAELAFHAMLRVARVGRKLRLNLGKIFFRKIHELLGRDMRYLATGGSRFDPVIGREFEDLGFVILQGYGLTETTGCATYTPPRRVNIASVGQPLPGMEVKILNPQQPVDGGPPAGEIAIRGRIVMKGYYKRPDATAAVLNDGWLRTGDLGYVDRGGNLVITGREKEIIVLSSGKNVYPEEIEAHYLKSPLIKEICVLGLENKPGEPATERLHGVVVPNFELLRQKKIVNTREALRFEIENLSTQLPSTKRILSYDIWQDDLPRTTTRKLKRFEIEQRVRKRQAQHAAEGAEIAPSRALGDQEQQWLALPEVARALAVVREAAKDRGTEIHPNDNLELDLGLDSMERVELLVALERELGGHAPESVVAEVYTVRELVDAVRTAARLPQPDAQVPQVRDRGVARVPQVRDHGVAHPSAVFARVGDENVSGASSWDTVLHSDPSGPEVLALAKSRPLAAAFWFLMTRLAYLVARAFFHLEVQGLEKLPASGAFILSANHQSYLDPPVLISILPWRIFRKAFYVGTSEIFGGGILRWVARSLKLVPVDPDANLMPAMRAGAYGLRHGNVLVLYPEGERSIDGTPKRFKKGAAILATHLSVPICPVALDGFYEAWPRGRRFQKLSRLRITIGDPIPPPGPAANAEKAYDELTRVLRSRIVQMWNKLHRELYPRDSVTESECDRKPAPGS